MVAVVEQNAPEEFEEFEEEDDWEELGRETRERSFYLTNLEEIRIIERFITGNFRRQPLPSSAGILGNT